jgi:hypothetical protein
MSSTNANTQLRKPDPNYKEIVSTEKVRDGNYNPKNAKTYDDRGQETREHRKTHIHNATSN